MKRVLFFILLVFLVSLLRAQDTLRISLRQADSLLVARNLSLIAFRYEVDEAEARTVQQRLFNNPELSTEWSLYNPGPEKWLDVGARGQKIIQIQQVFRIAGQRRASIRLSEEEKRMTQWQYYELARNLKYELHARYYRMYFLNHAIASIRSQLVLLKDLIEVYTAQYEKGNISLQELTRLNAVYFGINDQVNDTQAELMRLQESLQILLSDNRMIWPAPAPDENIFPDLDTSVLLPVLQDRALVNRPEIKAAESFQAQRELQYMLEKKQRVPNLMLGAVYDQSGSYINNYTGVSAGLQIPVFNRNQGKIQEARLAIQQSKITLQSKQQEIVREVETALKIVRLLRTQYESAGSEFETRLSQLSRGLVSNYSKGNISLLEFTDLFEAYNSGIIKYNQLKADLNNAYEELNYAVGEDVLR
jgi:outer membrane protein, heavy metal efflux system